jgi:hypothetical protein
MFKISSNISKSCAEMRIKFLVCYLESSNYIYEFYFITQIPEITISLAEYLFSG